MPLDLEDCTSFGLSLKTYDQLPKLMGYSLYCACGPEGPDGLDGWYGFVVQTVPMFCVFRAGPRQPLMDFRDVWS